MTNLQTVHSCGTSWRNTCRPQLGSLTAFDWTIVIRHLCMWPSTCWMLRAKSIRNCTWPPSCSPIPIRRTMYSSTGWVSRRWFEVRYNLADHIWNYIWLYKPLLQRPNLHGTHTKRDVWSTVMAELRSAHSTAHRNAMLHQPLRTLCSSTWHMTIRRQSKSGNILYFIGFLNITLFHFF